MKRLKPSAPFVIVFALAFAVRLVYNLVVAKGLVARDDSALYNQIGYAIAYQHCFCQYPGVPSISRPPLWPFILSIFYHFAPPIAFQQANSSIVVFYGRLFYCFIGSFSCVLVYCFARDLFGKRVGLLTGCLAAIYPGLFIYDGWVYAESLYTFLVTAFTYALYRLQRTRRLRWAIWGGAALGLANLVRPNAPILFGMLAIWAIAILLSRDIPWRVVAKGVVATCLVAVIIIAPWIYRNYQVSGTFVMISLGGGDVLLGAYNNDALNGAYHDNALNGIIGLWTLPSNIQPRPDLPDIVLAGHDAKGYTAEDDKLATDAALQWIQAHPGDALLLMGYHLKRMWTPFTAETNLPFTMFPNRPLSQVAWYMLLYMSPPIFILAALGLILTLRARWRQLLIVYASIALTILQNVLFYGNMRFRAPIEPLLVLLVGGVIWWFASKDQGTLRNWRASRKRREQEQPEELAGVA